MAGLITDLSTELSWRIIQKWYSKTTKLKYSGRDDSFFAAFQKLGKVISAWNKFTRNQDPFSQMTSHKSDPKWTPLGIFTESKHLCSLFEEILVSLRTKLVQG